MTPLTGGGLGSWRRAPGPYAFEGLEHGRRHRLRKSLWEPWRPPQPRSRPLVALGVDAERARQATTTGRGAWWNAGASPCTPP
jgi:RNA-directed DNA polymerase